MPQRVFTGFLILVFTVILMLLPISEGVYNFRTNPRTDSFTVTTAAGVTSANVVLIKNIYDDDTGTIVFASDDADDSPLFTSYNGTTRQVVFSGMAANTTRGLDITYDVDAWAAVPAMGTVSDVIMPWLLFIFIFVLFPVAGVVYAIWGDRISWPG